MPRTHIRTFSIALAVLWITCTVTLVAPQVVTANSHAQMEEASRDLSVVYPEQYYPEFALSPLAARLSPAGRPVPETRAVAKPRLEEVVRVELQVPEALVRALLIEERTNGSVELQVPEALLLNLATEGRVQMP